MKIIKKNPNKHEKTIIILKGMNQDDAHIYEIINGINNDIYKIILITPKKITIDWLNQSSEDLTSWYNYHTRCDNAYNHDVIDVDTFNKNCNSIIDLINKEAQKILPKDIYLIGVSQGGTVAIESGLRLKFSICKIICIDTIFLNSYNAECNSIQNFEVYQSVNDKIYNPGFQNICYNDLCNLNQRVNIYIHEGYHCSNTLSINNFILNCIK